MDKITELEKQIKTWENFNKNGELNEKITKAKEELENLKNGEVEEEINKDLLLCSHKDLLQGASNKQYNSYSYGIQLGFVDKERTNGEMNKYLYRNDIESRREELLADGIQVPSMRTLERDFKFLSQLGYVNIINTKSKGLCYIIQQSVDGKNYISISYNRWKKLITWTNKNMLRLYVVFEIKCNCNNYVMLTREYLCKCMGINPTEGNKKFIGTMVQGLERLGAIIIDRKHETIKIQDENGNTKYKNVTHNYYRLTTEKEFEDKK